MNNKDTILKYLSDLMDDKEKNQFEEKLKSDNDLRQEFERVQNNLEQFSISSEHDSDSAYFNNLVPKVRARMESKKKKRNLVLAPVISLGVTLVLIFMLQFPSTNQQSLFELDISNADLSEIVSQSDSFDVENLLGTNFVEDYAYYNSDKSGSDLDLYLDDSVISDVELDDVNSYYSNDQITDYDDFSNEQVDIVYKELINKKIL